MAKSKTKIRTSAQARAAKKRHSTNTFEGLPKPKEESEDEESDHDEAAAEIIKLPGSQNDDGTFYGGGPNDVYCSACKKAGYPNTISHGHRSNQWMWCPLLQTEPIAEKLSKQIMSPELKELAEETFPKKRIPAKNVPSMGILKSAPMEPDEILAKLSDGVLNPRAANT